MRPLLVLTGFAIFVLSACNRSATPVPLPSSDGVDSSAPSAQRSSPQRIIQLSLEPKDLEACTPAKPQIALVKWQFPAGLQKTIEISPLGPDGNPSGLFATASRSGEKESGPWMIPGQAIVAIDKQNRQELGRVVAGSRPCSQ